MSKHIDKSRFPQNPNVGDVFYADTLDMGAPPVGWRSTGIWVDIRSDEMGVTYRYDGTASDPMPTPLADQVAALEAIRDEQAETIAQQAAGALKRRQKAPRKIVVTIAGIITMMPL